MVETLVIGAAGRMGRIISSCIEDTEGINLSSATEVTGSPYIGLDAGELAGVGTKNVTLTDDLQQAFNACDVAIDFTTPESTIETFYASMDSRKAVVIGTTGFDPLQKEEIKNVVSTLKSGWLTTGKKTQIFENIQQCLMQLLHLICIQSTDQQLP